MGYKFVERHGIEYVRIEVGGDVIERPARKDDHATAAAVNDAEAAAAKMLAEDTKRRVARENEYERKHFDALLSERTRLDAEKASTAKPYTGEQGADHVRKQLELDLTPEVGFQKELEGKASTSKAYKPYARKNAAT